MEELLLSVEMDFAVLSFVRISCISLLYFFLSCPKLLKAGTRGESNFHSRMRERLGRKPDA